MAHGPRRIGGGADLLVHRTSRSRQRPGGLLGRPSRGRGLAQPASGSSHAPQQGLDRRQAYGTAVFLQTGTAYAVVEASKSWNLVDVSGFPSASPAFLSTSLEYGPLCCQLMQCRDELGILSMSLSSSTGLSVRLKDGKTLIFGDGANGASKIERGIAVLDMPAFKGEKATIDLRFDGQAVIAGSP
jgi:hypothetical protein